MKCEVRMCLKSHPNFYLLISLFYKHIKYKKYIDYTFIYMQSIYTKLPIFSS